MERFDMTEHARRRKEQFRLRQEAIEAALNWGRLVRQEQGRRAYHLGSRAVAAARKEGLRLDAYENTLVVVGPDEAIITVGRYREPRRLKGRRSRSKAPRGDHGFEAAFPSEPATFRRDER